ncbi:ribosome recycling factor [Candidatus Poribacteria bacterium]|mgnify:CR=1 FL=1|nr:MAG: ribosome recycling factor [Candidatus Poribacteria bacterium]
MVDERQLKSLLKETEERMKKAVAATSKEFAAVRAGRASAAMLEGITVDYYGSRLPINQLATISIPEPRMILIQPWDKNVLKDIEKAIAQADLGFNIISDKNSIRLIVPELTEERRKELVKVVRRMAEEGRVAIRNIRREAIETIRKMEREKQISEDDKYRYQDEIQKLTDKYIEQIDELLKAKEKELLEV